MKKKFITALTMITLVGAGTGASCLLAQDFADGPIGEISSGGGFAEAGSAGSEFVNRANTVYTSAGDAIEVFDPSVPTVGPEATSSSSTGADWITPDGRINLQSGDPQSPEAALWTPESSAAGDWTDGPMGVQLGVDWLFFSRAINGGAPFATNDAGETFSNADINVDPESTPRFRIGVASEYGTGYEFVTYDFDEFSGNLALTGEGIDPTFFGGTFAEPADSYAATYQSRIKSFELNVWSRRSEHLRVGYGLRHFSVEEKYDITVGADSTSTDPAAGGTNDVSGFFSKTDNNLFGGQVMVELYRRIAPGMYLEGGVKGLLLNNRVDIDANTANIDDSGEDSFLTGGVNFTGGVNYRVFRGFNLRAGYEGVFLGSVAAATSQSENNSLSVEPLSPFGESIYFGGGYLGCTLTF